MKLSRKNKITEYEYVSKLYSDNSDNNYHIGFSLFKEKGFKETSIQSIAKVAEVSPVSIYNYFDKKDNLVALCINELFKDIIQEAENILLSNIDYKSKLNQALALCQKKIS